MKKLVVLTAGIVTAIPAFAQDRTPSLSGIFGKALYDAFYYHPVKMLGGIATCYATVSAYKWIRKEMKTSDEYNMLQKTEISSARAKGLKAALSQDTEEILQRKTALENQLPNIQRLPFIGRLFWSMETHNKMYPIDQAEKQLRIGMRSVYALDQLEKAKQEIRNNNK